MPCVAVPVPVGNNTKHAITLPRKTALGSIHCVKKVIPTDSPETPRPTVIMKSAVSTSPTLVHVNGNPQSTSVTVMMKKREKVNKILCEGAGAFAHDNNNIGCIKILQMSITLQNQIPVQRTYSSVQKQLFKEVSKYIQKLQVPICSSSCVCQKERWQPKAVQWLWPPEKEDCSWLRSTAQDTGPDRHPLWLCLVY